MIHLRSTGKAKVFWEIGPGQDEGREEVMESYREEFPVTREWAYLNHAAIAPLPRRAHDRFVEMSRVVQETGDRRWSERNRECDRVRGLVARLLGARHSHEVAFVANTSSALSAVAAGLEWRSGENVVGALPEFPSNVYPWMALRPLGVEYRQVAEREGRIDLEELWELVDEGTRVVALSWVQYASGFRSDLNKIGERCREKGVLFVVDAIQGLGALRMDVERDLVDVVAAAAHKWLLGPEGVGVLFVSDRVVQRIRPVHVGWRSMARRFDWSRFDLAFAKGAARFEPGTLNVFGITALGASLEILLEVGPAVVEKKILELSQKVSSGLENLGFRIVSPRGGDERSGIVAATHDSGGMREIVADLSEDGVAVAERGGRLRVAPHFYNNDDDVGRLLEALSRRLGD